MSATIKPSKSIQIHAYFTDGQRLVMVVGFTGAAVIVEDAQTEREFIVEPDDFDSWSAVQPEAA